MAFGRQLDGCASFIKYSLFFSNFLILIGGLVIIGVGSWTLAQKAFVVQLLGTNLYLGVVYILIATGIFVSLVAILGCLGAIKEIKCMLLMYFIIVFILFVSLLIGGILGYVFRDKVSYTMRQEMLHAMRSYGHKPEITYAWDTTQSTLECCGVEKPSDWLGQQLTTVPKSCCRKRYNQPHIVEECSGYQDFSNAYLDGCYNKTVRYVQDHASVMGGAGIGVACIMLLGMIFSCGLFMSLV